MSERGQKVFKVLVWLVIVIACVLALKPKITTILMYSNNSFLGMSIGDLSGDGEKSNELLMDDFFNQEEYEDFLKVQCSDIEGMSKYDKYVLGLDPSDGADSDFDGLTDKEEIEIYGTNPTKPSTSGDLYMDGYKVKTGMDVNKVYEYKEEYVFTGNSCPEIYLTPIEAFDFNACVIDRTDSNMYRLTNKEVLRTYYVSFYTGYVTIDLDEICDVVDASKDDLAVYVQKFYESVANEVKVTKDGSRITLQEKYEYNMPYVIYIVKEENMGKDTDLVNNVEVTFGSLAKEEQEMPIGVVYGSPLLAALGKKLNVVYEQKSTEEETLIARQQMVDVANAIQEGVVTTKVTDECVRAASREEIETIIRAYDVMLSEYSYTYEVGNIDSKKHQIFFIYYTYEDYLRDKEKISEVKQAEEDQVVEGQVEETKFKSIYAGTFDPYKDTLPFSNFRSSVGKNGVCAGIAHLTSNLFNNKTLSKSAGTFTYKNETYSWDITSDEENRTLLDTGLRDYKTSKFVKEHTSKAGYLEKNLSEGEQNFVTMIGYFYAKGNAAFSAKDYMKGCDGRDADKDVRTMNFYDGQVIRNMVGEIDNGRIVDGYFLMDNGSGHVVNIYGYEETKIYLEGRFTDGYVFYVYDCNYPDVRGTLVAEIFEHTNGQETLHYYLDIPGASYAAYSNSGRQNLFVVLDSEFNVLSN